MMYDHGLVVGKFYPFHKGHQSLVDAALSECSRVTVLVVDQPAFTIPGEVRADWIRELYPTADVRTIHDIYDDNNSPRWGAYTISLLGKAPDVVYTSEAYGDPYARAMGCTHVMVDAARLRIPCSGTMIRSDPWRYAEFLSPVVRAYFVKRIVVAGAESTGTTTLARELAVHYRTAWVPEYGRYYWDGKLASQYADWDSREFTHIARMQGEAEDRLATHAHRYLFCDTDPLATTIWHLHYMGRTSREVGEIAAARQYALYLITAPDIPLEQDGTRDAIPEARQLMHERFVRTVSATGIPYAIIVGSREARLTQAIRLITHTLES